MFHHQVHLRAVHKSRKIFSIAEGGGGEGAQSDFLKVIFKVIFLK